MSASRLLVVADPKMLPALSAGLREGGKFEVTGLPYADLAPVAQASETTDVLVLFYGSPARTLPQALEQLAAPLRARGARVIAVLQKDTAGQRDDCFRHGASDVLFMPLPKEAFVQKVLDAAQLALPGEEGAEVSGTLTIGAGEATPLAQTKLVPGGVRLGALAAKPGDTVKLSLEGGAAPLVSWGLVAQITETAAAVRFAGLNPDEENKLRDLFKAKGLSLPIAPTKPPPPKPPPAVMRPVAPPSEPPPSFLAPPSGPMDASVSAPPTVPTTQVPPLDPSQPLPNAAPGIAPLGPPPGMRVAPTGPPPGFADRPHIRPHVATGKIPPRSPTPMGIPVPNQATPPAAPLTNSPPAGASEPIPVAPAPAPNAATPPGGAAQPIIPALANGPAITPAAGASTPVGSPTTTPAGAAPVPAAGADGAPAAAPGASGTTPSPAPLAASGAAAATPAADGAAAPAPIPGPNDLGGLSGLFDDGSGAGAAPQAAATPDGQPAPEAQVPTGPLWPGALDLEACKAVAALMYKDRYVPPDTNPDMAAAARKVVLGLSSVEREALEKSGADSHLYEALHARMVMAVANAAATRLFASQPPAVVDAPSLTSLVQMADAAAKRLQGEADKAITGGQVESLQMTSAASSALSREQLTLKESADRLRGIAAAPRMGAGALDPDVQVPGQAPTSRPLPRDKATEKIEVRAELKDFAGFDDSPKSERNKRRLWIALGVFALSMVNLIFFANQGAKDASQTLLERAGTGVMHISVAEKTAIVTVTPGWLAIERRANALSTLCEAMRSVKVDRVAIMIDNVGITGQVDVQHDCTPYGLTGGKGLPPGTPPPAPAPGK